MGNIGGDRGTELKEERRFADAGRRGQETDGVRHQVGKAKVDAWQIGFIRDRHRYLTPPFRTHPGLPRDQNIALRQIDHALCHGAGQPAFE